MVRPGWFDAGTHGTSGRSGRRVRTHLSGSYLPDRLATGPSRSLDDDGAIRVPRCEEDQMIRTNLKLALGTAAVLGAGVVAGVALSGGGAIAAPVSSAATTDPSAPGAAGGPRHEHTEVTGDELDDVAGAVASHDDTVEVESVRKDPDGSYDVLGTRDGEPVVLEVSADLATVTEREDGPGRGGPCGPGGRGGPGGTTGQERPESPAPGATTTPSSLRVA